MLLMFTFIQFSSNVQPKLLSKEEVSDAPETERKNNEEDFAGGGCKSTGGRTNFKGFPKSKVEVSNKKGKNI